MPGAVTEVAPLKTFYPAEAYHQQYLENVSPDVPSKASGCLDTLRVSSALLCCWSARADALVTGASLWLRDGVLLICRQGGRGGRAQSARKMCNDPVRWAHRLTLSLERASQSIVQPHVWVLLM